MLNNKLIVAILATSFAAAQEIGRDDIPQDCRSICQPVLDIIRRCDVDNDSQERGCICETANSAAFATCNDCTLRYLDFFVDINNDGDDDDDDDDDDNRIENEDNEVNIWYNRCAFGGNSATGTMTSAPTASLSMTTAVFTTTLCDDDAFEDDDDDDFCTTRVVTGVVPVRATTTIASGNTATSSASTTLLTGTQSTQTTQTSQTAQSTGNAQASDSNDDDDDNNNNDNDNSNNDSGAGSMAIPMLGAGIGAAFAALIAM